MIRILAILILVSGFSSGACAGAYAGDDSPIEATSLTGEALHRPVVDAEYAALHEDKLVEAQAAFAADPTDATALVWVGRRLGYLGRYQDAIATFRDGAERFPDDARFLRHLGHRLISVRDFEGAASALERAARLTSGQPNTVEPDGLPNPQGIPTSTLKGNIWYHLGLVKYLIGDFDGAGDAYETAAAVAANPDAMVAARYWVYLCRARAGDLEAAEASLWPVTDDLPIIENHAYYRLALSFQGEGSAEDYLEEIREGGAPSLAALGYGIAAKRLIDGDAEGARALMEEILETGKDNWSSFGFIAAEADLARGLTP